MLRENWDNVVSGGMVKRFVDCCVGGLNRLTWLDTTPFNWKNEA